VSFPSERPDALVFEGVGTASDDIYEEDYSFTTNWFPTNDTKTIRVVMSVPTSSAGRAAVEEGILNVGDTDPRTVCWHELDSVATHTAVPPGHGGRTVNTLSQDVGLGARYFRVHVFGFTSSTGVFLSVRRIERIT
jgi:hypothetical protein